MIRKYFANRTASVITLLAVILTAPAAVPTLTASAQSGGIYCNCVEYARSRVPSLPRGMDTMAGKRAAINSYTPVPGAVAIIEVGGAYRDIGHVAVVTAVNPTNGNITIEEANYSACRFGRRAGAPASLHVVGYYVPPGVSRPGGQRPGGRILWGPTDRRIADFLRTGHNFSPVGIRI